jgi:DNA-binding XRE family transcriptional regulator
VTVGHGPGERQLSRDLTLSAFDYTSYITFINQLYRSKSKVTVHYNPALSTIERELTKMQAVVYVGDRLKALRIRRALTQEELARRAGLSKNAVNRLEVDKAEPRMSTLRKLAQALGVDPSELIGE